MNQHYISVRIMLKMAILKVNRRNPTFTSLSDLVMEISRLGLVGALQEFHNKKCKPRA
ncbi:MAG TPA: hypothetical protein VK553_07030 [Candidatus Nitrosopolaris rasttigaisensis]|nr:hypothetical protein [Candidatus Nitrosopolaris rasttigaisensis]